MGAGAGRAWREGAGGLGSVGLKHLALAFIAEALECC